MGVAICKIAFSFDGMEEASHTFHKAPPEQFGLVVRRQRETPDSFKSFTHKIRFPNND